MEHRYRKTDSVVTRKIAGETMLVPIHGNMADMERIFALDEVSGLIWNLLDKSSDPDELTAAVVRDFDVSPDVARKDTEAFLCELKEAGLVEIV
jgi:hypothetical protein